MKKIALLSAILLLFTAFPFAYGCSAAEPPIRIHIRANSDGDYDQAVKYVVRDEVVNYLTGVLSPSISRSVAYKRISEALSDIEKTAMRVLSRCGFAYGAVARMSYEYFPDRNYGEVFYPAGYYDALVLSLGSGKGGNWWCVAYPPLCFYGDSEEEFAYDSLIAELIGRI